MNQRDLPHTVAGIACEYYDKQNKAQCGHYNEDKRIQPNFLFRNMLQNGNGGLARIEINLHRTPCWIFSSNAFRRAVRRGNGKPIEAHYPTLIAMTTDVLFI